MGGYGASESENGWDIAARDELQIANTKMLLHHAAKVYYLLYAGVR